MKRQKTGRGAFLNLCHSFVLASLENTLFCGLMGRVPSKRISKACQLVTKLVNSEEMEIIMTWSSFVQTASDLIALHENSEKLAAG